MKGRKLTLRQIKAIARHPRPRPGSNAYMRWWKARKALGLNTKASSLAEMLRKES